MSTPNLAHMSIGTVAREAGLSVDTIRYYERERLLPAPPRRASGYRDYDAAAVARLRFVRRAKTLGFSLDDIRELLALSQDRHNGVAGVKRRAQERLAVMDARIRDLRRVQKGLRELIDACAGSGATQHCPILRALDKEDVCDE